MQDNSHSVQENKRSLYQRKAGLLWKSMERQEEVQSGLVRLNKEVTLRILTNKPEDYLNADRYTFTQNTKDFLKTVVTMNQEKREYFIFRIYDSYRREINYMENRNEQFSMDILFQVIETLTIEKQSKATKTGYLNLGSESLTKADIEMILNHIRAFNFMAVQFEKIGNIKKAIEYTDRIILRSAILNPNVTVQAMDNMFSLILAQNLLAIKYGVNNLLSGWMGEYGFSKEEAVRIIPLFPKDSSLNDFRSIYSKAMQTLVSQSKNSESKESDLFMLRTICNYFTSWLNRVATQFQVV